MKRSALLLVTYTVISASSTVQVTCYSDADCKQAIEAIEKDEEARKRQDEFCSALIQEAHCSDYVKDKGHD